MRINPILIVPTYSYLSSPIIEKLMDLKGLERDMVCLDFYQPRADFGLVPDTEKFKHRENIFPDHDSPSVLEIRGLRKKLLSFLSTLNPELIITFSDITFFARCIKGTRFENRLIVMQPCLLSMQSPTWTRKVFYTISSIVNRFIGCPILRENHSWGEVLDRATYLVWGKVERNSRKIVGTIYECGNYFFESVKPVEILERQNSVLVIVPDLLFYTKEKIETLTSSYSRILESFLDINFYFKYHPRNNLRLSLSDKENYREIPIFSIADADKYEIILASFSNLSVMLRCVHQKVIVFDIGWYVDLKNEYFSRAYFKIPANTNELFEQFCDLRKLNMSNVEPNAYLNTFFPISTDFLQFMDKYFMYPITRIEEQ